VVLDNTVISSLHLAGALAELLLCWEGRWILPLQVRDEAAAWKAHGAGVILLLNTLHARGVFDLVSPEPGPEATLFAELTRTRGQGESAAIAIAHFRQAAIATDDRQARRSCEALNPPVRTLTTEGLLAITVGDGLLSATRAIEIWTSTGIRDPNRRLRL
jgi:predicted nucleic acid-binding protein